MKRPLRILSLLVIVLVLVRGSEYLLEEILDRKLPPLLTEQLGLPVRIAPIRADIISLTAKTGRLEMGEPDKLSIDAQEVWVSLDWADLLSGEIRLVSGAGREVMVDVSAWPKDDDPPKDDYSNLEQWLPSTLDATLVRYRREDGIEFEFYQARWRRDPGDSASLAWQNRFPTGLLDVDVHLHSLDDLLWLREFDADITMATDDDDLPASELAMLVSPGTGRPYQMKVEGELAGMPLDLAASGSESWSLPDRSVTRAEHVYSSTLIELLTLFLADGEEDEFERELASQVPVIDLPRHDAELQIGELHFGREMLHNVGFNLTTSGSYLAATSITASGLYGDLLGSAAVASTDDGWDVALAADLSARQADKGLMARYVTSNWLARQGRIRLKSSGATWHRLLDELAGDLRLSGGYRGKTETPVRLVASLDGSPDRFALEQIELQLGDSLVTGMLDISTRGDKFLKLSARGSDTDIRFMMDAEGEVQEPGIALPTFLTWLPGYRLTADLEFDSLLLPDLRLSTLSASLDRRLDSGTLSVAASGLSGGLLEIELDYLESDAAGVDTTLDFKLDRVHLPELFGLGGGAIDSRSSGTVALKARGDSVEEVFQNSRGLAKLDIEIRDDEDWGRPSHSHEVVNFSGQTSLLIEGNSVTGVRLDAIDIDSIEQDVTGSLSLIVTRDPVMVADLRSERLNIDQIVDWMPDSAQAADEEGVLGFLRDAAPGRVTLHVDSLTWLDRSFDKVEIQVDSRPRYFAMERIEFGHRGSTIDGSFTLNWNDQDTAVFNAKGSIADLQLLDVTKIDDPRLRAHLEAPLAGHLLLESEGTTLEQLLIGFNGELLLTAVDPGTQKPDKLDITFERLPNGGRIKFRELHLAGSDLRGELVSTAGTPTRYDLELHGGSLDLRPWALVREKQETEEKKTGAAENAIQATASVARDVVGFAGRLFGNTEQATEEGQRVFSSETLDMSELHELDLKVHGKLGQLYSEQMVARELEVDFRMGGGRLEIQAQAAEANGGPLSGSFTIDANVTPHPMTLKFKGEGIYRRPAQDSYPSSMHGIATSSGMSEAELAANLNGQAFLELGRGPMDYDGLTFLTADAASSMFRALIPGTEQRVPEVRCGVTFMQITDGVGIMPYGYAVQTREANLLGGIEFNLVDERIRVQFRSRSRKGVGISIGNAFSSTVELSGPLNNPRIVPNTPSLLVRGWAAFMTAGLSVLGESVINRALAGDDPCDPIREEIRRDVCSSDQLLSTSPLVCPAPAVATN